MYKATCHCENIELTVEQLPLSLTECNCSMCYRYGAVWGYYQAQQISLTINNQLVSHIDASTHPAINNYCWGDGYIHFHSCANCGCVTHYSSTAKAQKESGRNDDTSKVAINMRMLPRHLTESIKVRHFDGADTWLFID